jgi:hypothetical protein
MTDEEKLRQYLRQNTLEEKKVESPQKEEPAPVFSKSKTTPTEWYSDKLWSLFRFVMMFGLFLPALVLAVMTQDSGLEVESAVVIGLLIAAGEAIVMGSLLLYRYLRYKRWMNGKYYRVTGWQQFFANRTKKFWEQRNYTTVRVDFHLAANASDLHRQVLKTFTAKAVSKWKKDYEEMKFIGKAPKELQSSGGSIYGEISQRELIRFMRILNPKFIPVSKLLGEYLQDVVIKSDSIEKTFEIRKSEDPDDDYTKNQRWVDLHTNND